MCGDQVQTHGERDSSESRALRVTTLKNLVAERGYDVPAEEVAASIIRDAIVVVPPMQRRR